MAVLRRLFSRRTLAYATGGTALATGSFYWYLNSGPAYPSSTKEKRRPPPPWTPPSRTEMLTALRKSGEHPEDEFDLLIVGGGATGAGVAVDAASRGLKVALVDRDDFAAGTSSKSTKLVHGGVRYLQKAVFELDYDQYKLVREALHERRIFLQTAPYLSNMLPIMLPVYKYWQVPYYLAGCKLYDVLAGKENMETSYVMSKGKALETFPMLKSDGLVGAVVYYDGQHNDSRMNIALMMSAVKHGATVANYCEVTHLHKDSDGKLTGASVRDNLTGKEWNVGAKGIINATGPFTDTLLTLDNPSHKPIVQPSSGIHITLPNYYSPRKMGLLDPSTSDGRVIFFLPWQGNTIAGTTDSPASVERSPHASEEDIRWVLEEVRSYLAPDIKVRRGDVLSAWSGLRPLVRNPGASSTEGLVRNHMIHVSESGLVTIAGGKWTTYRAMAEETVDKAVEVFGLGEKVRSGCVTESLKLVGSDGWSRNMFIGLIQTYGLESDVAKHLSDNYGDRAWTVCGLAEPTGENWPLHGKRLSPQYPFIEAEVRYVTKHEYALTAIDILARRTRLSFLNARAALDALPRIIDIMSEELNWSRTERNNQIREAVEFLVGSMGLDQGYVSDAGGRSGHDVGLGVRRVKERVQPRGWVERSERGVWWAWGSVSRVVGAIMAGKAGVGERGRVLGRAKFEVGEVGGLKSVFDKHAVSAKSAAGAGGDTKGKIDKGEVLEIVKYVPGYEEVTRKELEYVLEEAGFMEREELDWEEFLEVCGGLREVIVSPAEVHGVGANASAKTKSERRVIPVEKSGGGV
ncbi:DAO-domain-containing protein [Macrolepiota fuliginosa MF-IS2]|uniref:Glycerol-3-phosphate dehydrogenase n=1 Tax=Macrolepiota fuliginosa MF-IS2 TaxID=1400762 RepID=A0A9P6C3R7_9AGAR|nr:DAO-domain-containing protein [Macrolepiota fuliginosa MF-IS2]